ncbi:MAG: NPCBM/NEW2 domain-containing protein [Pirellulaceae bacterium]|nr:NPCBM/NEW2 domain-containing protein [Pirellulaceae bacterium]
MAPHPDNSNSSGATIAMIAAVVIGVLILGVLAMVTLGFLFFFTVQDRVVYEMTTDPVMEVVEQLPVETPASGESQVVEETEGTQPELPAATEVPGESGQVDVPASGTAAESPMLPSTDSPVPATESPRTKLADLTPLERIDVRLGDAPPVRAVNVGGRSYPSAIWAQPSSDLGTCQISYPVQQAYSRLTGMAAVADAAGADVAVVPKGTFHIYADGNLLWNSGPVEGFGSSKSFDVDVSGIRLLVFVVESDAVSAASPFAWADLQLVPASVAGSP